METQGHVSSGRGKEQIMCFCEIGSKILGSAKRGEFLGQFYKQLFLKPE
jgi:hypothetical protein